MNRRKFIKQSLWAAGAVTLLPSGAVAAMDGSKGVLARETQPTPGAPLGVTPDPMASFRKSMFWGSVSLPGSVLEKCQALRAAGFEGVEMDSHMNRSEVLQAVAQSGLTVSGVCNAKHWEWPLSSEEPQVRQQGCDAMRVALEDAHAYGTDTVLLVPGAVNEQVTYTQCWERSTACIRELLPTAERLGVTIAIENVWNNFLLSPREAAQYVDQFDSPHLKFYFDAGNIVAYGFPEQWIDLLGPRLQRIHIKEYSRKMADTQGRWAGFAAPLGEGDVAWPTVVEALRKNYLNRWLTIEHGGGNTPEGLQSLSDAWGRIALG